MASATEEQSLLALKATVSNICSLIAQLQATAPATEAEDDAKDVDALALAHDTASLIKAHSTKLSLLIINKPFTATAVNTVLRELTSKALPGLASAVQICSAAKYTKAMSEELQWSAKKIFLELGTLIKAIPLDGQILSNDKRNGTGKTEGKGSLAATGVVWEACDRVMALKNLGIAGLMIQKVEEYKDLLLDALEELHSWGEEESDGDENDEDVSSDDDHDVFGSPCHIPSEDPHKIRSRLESSLKRLRLIITMYTAVIKRRFKILPQLPCLDPPAGLKSSKDVGVVGCLDEVLAVMRKIPNATDELASAFYDLDAKEIDKRMDECFFQGFAAAELLLKNWEGQNDEFTTWATKFQSAMKKGW